MSNLLRRVRWTWTIWSGINFHRVERIYWTGSYRGYVTFRTAWDAAKEIGRNR